MSENNSSYFPQIRVPPDTKELLKQLYSTTDIRQACLLVIELIEKHVKLESQIPSKYDVNTGKPTSFRWRCEERFENDIYLGGDNMVAPGEDEIRLHPKVLKVLVRRPSVIRTPEGFDYSFVYKEEHIPYEGGSDNRYVIEIVKLIGV